MTHIEVQIGTNEDRLKRDAARLNDTAFPGQRYSVEPIDAANFAIVLHDGKAQADAPLLTSRPSRVRRNRVTTQDFTSLAGTRSHRRASGGYHVYG